MDKLNEITNTSSRVSAQETIHVKQPLKPGNPKDFTTKPDKDERRKIKTFFFSESFMNAHAKSSHGFCSSMSFNGKRPTTIKRCLSKDYDCG